MLDSSDGLEDDKKDNGVAGELKEHFEVNISYFSKLLKKDFSNNRSMLTKSDLKKIKEAYDKAHHIREYEINLFWSRLNYLWLINAVLFSAWGALLYSFIDNKNIIVIQYIALFLLSLLGSSFSYLVFSIAKAGKYWQQVWEYHVRTLEPFVSGGLYSMIFIQRTPIPSISRSINFFIFLTMIVWLLSAVFSVVLPLFSSRYIIFYEVFSILPIVLMFYFIDKVTKTPSEESIKLNLD